MTDPQAESMTNEGQSAEDIFGTALDLPPEVRLAYVDAACHDSCELRDQVVALLADHQRLGDFLAAPPISLPGAANPGAMPSTSPGLAAGWKLGRYTILAPLGVGGMGAVYRARDERLEREVAIKVLFPDLLQGESTRTRFRKEALALARLSHANIAAIHDVGEDNGIDYIVMECIAGQTLAAKLKHGPLPVEEALSIAQQVARALEEAHELGVIHRDLKPANIMITARGNVKVLDFGIAKLMAADVTMTADAGTLIGTPVYMSPEQIQGRNVDFRTDLWSLGVVLYESLAGRTPFAADGSFATMQAIVAKSPVSVRTLRPEVPPGVESIVARLLEKDAEMRFQSAQEIVRDTSAALAHIALSSPPQPKTATPTLPLMHAVFILAGFGTMLLGPILPLLAARWQLSDSQSGLLLLSQFVGATLGGVTVSSRLSRDLQRGLIAAGLGFTVFAIAPTFILALPCLLVGGFGVGRTIATVNIIAGDRFPSNRGAALSRLNFTWSFGALLSPLMAAWLVSVPLQFRLIGFAILFLMCAAILDRQSGESIVPSNPSLSPQPTFPQTIFLYFATLLFLYGGLETCLSGWLTTYAIRYGKESFVLSQYTLVLLLSGLVAGRALAAWLLLRMRDTVLQRLALLISAVLAAGLAAAHQASLIATLAVLLGVCLAPIFPATFAIFLANRPPARLAGIVLAASGLGAAALPWLMGVVSTRFNSLQLALILPVAIAAAMLSLSALSPSIQPRIPQPPGV